MAIRGPIPLEVRKLIGAKKNRLGSVARRAEYDGITYDSKLEAARAAELDLLAERGEILTWFRQVPVYLGTAENLYRVDFLVIPPPPARPWCEDVKGVETETFRRNRRLWKAWGPLDLYVLKEKKDPEILPRGRRLP